MNELFIIVLTGFCTFVLGILLLKREKRLFKDSTLVQATVVTYYAYNTEGDGYPKYTMAVEYLLSNGQLIHAREQSGSTVQKYPVGQVIPVYYSNVKPDFFIVSGDHSRIIIFWGMIIVGFAMVAFFSWAAFNGY